MLIPFVYGYLKLTLRLFRFSLDSFVPQAKLLRHDHKLLGAVDSAVLAILLPLIATVWEPEQVP